MKKTALFLTAVLIIVSCTSCWDYEEYEQLALVFALGFDRGSDNNIIVTAEYVSSAKTEGEGGSSGKGAGSSGRVEPPIRQVVSRSVAGCIDELQKVVDRQVFFGYTRIIIIGKEAAEKDMERIIEFLELTPYVRPSVNIIICDGSASEVISTIDMRDVTPTSKEAEDMLFNIGRTAKSFPVSLQDFLKILERDGFEPVLPQIITEEASVASEDKNSVSKEVLGLVKVREGQHLINGTAVFKKYKLKGLLNEKESGGLAWVLNKNPNIHITITGNLADEDGQNAISVRTLESKTKLEIVLSGEVPKVYIKTKVHAALTQFDSGDNVLTSKLIDEYENKLAESIKSDINHAIVKAKALNCDILGFGFRLFQQYTKEWQKVYSKKWDEVFPKLPVYVEVEANISSSGIKELSTMER